MSILRQQHGQSLIEVLIAFAALSVIIVSTTLVVISALTNAQFVKNQHLATEYAQQGIELVRSMRENNFDAFLSLSNPGNLPTPDNVEHYCMAKACTQLTTYPGDCGLLTTPSCTAQNLDAFVRGVTIDRTRSSSCINPTFEASPPSQWPSQVTVAVSWADGQCPQGSYCHTVSVTTCLSPINNVVTP